MRGASTARSDRSRLRLVVVQALVFSLFATLFVRLYYLQVIGGESYQAQAADQSVVPAEDDTVVTFGSDGGAPYVAGIPVGKVTSVYTSLRETSQRAVLDPFVDFASLDLVGVVVPPGTHSDRSVIEADGRMSK